MARHHPAADPKSLCALTRHCMIGRVRDAIVVLDGEGRIRFWNAAAERIYGWGRAEVLGRQASEVMGGGNGEAPCPMSWQADGAEGHCCGERRRRNRAEAAVVVDCSCTPLRDEEGRRTGTVSIQRDITEPWRDRQRLHLLEAAIGNARDGILISRAGSEDPFEYRIEYVNRALCEQTGYAAEELEGQPARILLGPDENGDIARIAEHLRKRLPLTAAFLARRKDGSCFWSEVSVVPLVQAGLSTHVASIQRDISDRRRMEEALRASEERFRIAAESASDVIYECDLSTGRLEFFGATDNWLAYPPAELPRDIQEWQRLIHPEDAKRVVETFRACAASGQPLCQEYRMRRRDGSYSDRMVRGRVVRDAAGRACKWIGASVDITERKRYEEALARSEQRFRALIQNSVDGIVVLDRQGRLVFDSPAARRILGTEENERLGCSIFERVCPEDLPAARAAFQEMLDRPGETVWLEVRGRHKDGSLRWMEVAGTNLLHEPSVEGMVLNYHDVTERKRAEEALRESERRYRELVENASDLIYSYDTAGNFLSINAAAERATGYTREEALGMNLAQVLAPEYLDGVRAASEKALAEGGPPTTTEIEIVTKEGRRLAVEDRSRWVFRDGVPLRAEGVARDITQRKRAELLERDRRQALEMVAQHNRLDTVLGHLAEMVRRQYPRLAVSVLLLRQERLERVAGAGLPEGYARAGAAIGPTAACAGSAAYWAQAVTSGDIESDPLWDEQREAALAYRLRSCAAVPMLSGKGPVLGVLETYAADPHLPDAAEMELLEAVARLASIAIEHRQLTDQLAFQARHEPLTGLPNRLLFEDRLEQALAQARRARKSAALLFIDLDRFKLINDTLGHAAGDLVLQQVARRLEKCLRACDTLARTGGDEFNVILGDLEDRRRAVAAAQRLLNALQRPFLVDGSEVFVSASIGISIYPRDATDAAALRRDADYALYVAKSRGRNRFQLFTPRMNTVQRERLELESGLHRALEHGELSVAYQPLFEVVSGRMAGLEALLRWDHPRLGQIRPERFIPIAEETGLIAPISGWVLEEVCRHARDWKKRGRAPGVVAVNVSPLQFARVDLAKRVADTIAAYGLEPCGLELELTESLIMRNVEESARQMSRLRGLGARISIDDFGTGHSSLSHLQQLPIDNLKIDRIFVQGMAERPSSEPLVRAVVELAHSLGMTATAEGVETERQMEALRTLRCDKVQGFLLGRPCPAEAVATMLPAQGGAGMWPPAVSERTAGRDSKNRFTRRD